MLPRQDFVDTRDLLIEDARKSVAVSGSMIDVVSLAYRFRAGSTWTELEAGMRFGSWWCYCPMADTARLFAAAMFLRV